jgi:hypothetical protein
MVGESIADATWSAAGEGEQLWFVGTLATIRVRRLAPRTGRLIAAR